MTDFYAKKIHMVGIKGQGMTALAELLKAQGAAITGSDTAEEFNTEAVLERLGVKPFNFAASNIKPNLDLVVYSSAYGKEQVERRQAKKLGIKQISYAEALAEIFNAKKGILVAGTHGKTTTTALLGHILAEAGLDPTVAVGGVVANWNANVLIGRSEWMVAEGDEYQKKFLLFKPYYLVLTTIDYDHPDTFKSPEEYIRAFEALKAQTLKRVFSRKDAIKGLDTGNLIGAHNQLNVGLAARVAQELGVSRKNIEKAVKSFRGVGRRLEIYYQSERLIVADDYAHHPTEIQATLRGLKEKYPGWQIRVVFEPHTYSRTKALLKEFAGSFSDADEVVLLPIFSSARERAPKGKDLAQTLFEALKQNHAKAFFGRKNINLLLKDMDKEKIFFLTMGAGDVWQIARKLKKKLALR